MNTMKEGHEVENSDYINDIVDIKERVARIETMLTEQLRTSNAEKELQEEKTKNLGLRVDKLESNQKWLVVTVIGAVILAILKVVLKF